MNRGTVIIGFIMLGGLVYLTAKGSLNNYLSLLGV